MQARLSPRIQHQEQVAAEGLLAAIWTAVKDCHDMEGILLVRHSFCFLGTHLVARKEDSVGSVERIEEVCMANSDASERIGYVECHGDLLEAYCVEVSETRTRA